MARTSKGRRSIGKNKGRISLRLVNGERTDLVSATKVRVRIVNGSQKILEDAFFSTSQLTFDVPFYNNFSDSYTIIVTLKDHLDCGYSPVHITGGQERIVSLMLLSKHTTYQFLPWQTIKSEYRYVADVFELEDPRMAEDRYTDLCQPAKQPVLASFLNLLTAMLDIHLAQGTPLTYIKGVNWDNTFAQDRFFGYADVELIRQVREAVQKKLFAQEPGPGLFHKDATCSYKQTLLGEANVQLTFHEGTIRTIESKKCCLVEPDIDDYRDLGAHTLLEVIPNTLGHKKTDPKEVYVLRWVGGQQAGIAEFNPPYSLV